MSMEGDKGHNAIWLAYMHHAMLLHSMYDYSMLDILASIPIWLYYIPFLFFAILLPCIWHLSFVHAGFSLCNALCHSSFYHYSYSVLPLFLLRHAIIALSMLTAIIHPDGASLVHRSQTLLWYNQCNGGYDQFVTAETLIFNGGFTWEKKRKDGWYENMNISFCVCNVFKKK